MRKLELVYCFSKQLSVNDDNFNKILYCLNRSVECNAKFHDIKIYTDEYTYRYLKNINANVEVFEYPNFRFLDDIKIDTLQLLKENQILVDPDVFLFKELIIEVDCDLILERPENISDPWYKKDYKDSKKFKFSNHLNFSSKTGNVGNIGIIKFINPIFLNLFINKYKMITNLANNEELPPFPKFSILFGQLLLQNMIDLYDYNVKYVKENKKNKYIHLAGENKYKNDGVIDKIMGKKTLI
jgi:hypothetical protein